MSVAKDEKVSHVRLQTSKITYGASESIADCVLCENKHNISKYN